MHSFTADFSDLYGFGELLRPDRDEFLYKFEYPAKSSGICSSRKPKEWSKEWFHDPKGNLRGKYVREHGYFKLNRGLLKDDRAAIAQAREDGVNDKAIWEYVKPCESITNIFSNAFVRL